MDKKPLPIMLDTETLGFPGNSAIVDIAMVNILTDEKFEVLIKPSEYDRPLAENYFFVDGETVEWHLSKGHLNSYSNAVRYGGTIRGAVHLVRETVSEWAGEDYEPQIWCQGTDFDIPVMTNLFNYVGCKLPWKYSQVKDLRTLTSLCKSVKRQAWGDHTALQDCIYQADHLKNIANKYRIVEELLYDLGEDSSVSRLQSEKKEKSFDQ